MYEDYVSISPEAFSEVFWREEYSKKALSFFEYQLGELDAIQTFKRSTPQFFLMTSTSRQFENEEVWNLGKKAFDAIDKVIEGGLTDNSQIEKVCYLSITSWLTACREEYAKGNKIFVGENRKPLELSEVEELGATTIAINMMAHSWPYCGKADRGVIELGINSFILHALDGLIISWLMEGWGADDFQWFYSLSSKLKEWELVQKESSKKASNAAKARHSETEWIKTQVYEYYDQHKGDFKSLREAAQEIAKREPVKFRTIYDWLRNRS